LELLLPEEKKHFVRACVPLGRGGTEVVVPKKSMKTEFVNPST
jgi:hypothetical protein